VNRAVHHTGGSLAWSARCLRRSDAHKNPPAATVVWTRRELANRLLFKYQRNPAGSPRLDACALRSESCLAAEVRSASAWPMAWPSPSGLDNARRSGPVPVISTGDRRMRPGRSCRCAHPGRMTAGTACLRRRGSPCGLIEAMARRRRWRGRPGAQGMARPVRARAVPVPAQFQAVWVPIARE
jgi:hypothetical protein